MSDPTNHTNRGGDMKEHNDIIKDQRVHHAFPREMHGDMYGAVLDTRDHIEGYDCLVKWDSGEQGWYKCTALIVDLPKEIPHD